MIRNVKSSDKANDEVVTKGVAVGGLYKFDVLPVIQEVLAVAEQHNKSDMLWCEGTTTLILHISKFCIRSKWLESYHKLNKPIQVVKDVFFRGKKVCNFIIKKGITFYRCPRGQALFEVLIFLNFNAF